MRIYLLALLILLTAIFNGGCWDQKPISNLAIVIGLGVDLVDPQTITNDEQVLVTVELAHPNFEDIEGHPALLSASGRTIQEAVRNLQQGLNLRLHWSHLETLLIGRSAAHAGIADYLYLFFHDHEMPATVYIVIAEGAAKDILYGQIGLSPYVATGIRELLRNQHGPTNGFIAPVRIQEYRASYAAPATGLLIPLIAFLPAQVAQASANPLPAANGSADEVAAAENEDDNNLHTAPAEANSEVATSSGGFLYLRGMAIIDTEQRYIGQLQGYQNSGAHLWLNQINNFSVLVKDPDTQRWLAVEINFWHSRQDWQINPETGQVQLFVQANTRGYLVGAPNINRYHNPELLQQLTELVAEELQRQMQAAWQQMLIHNTDFLQLGQQLWRHHHVKWQHLANNWPGILATVEPNIQINTQIQFTP